MSVKNMQTDMNEMEYEVDCAIAETEKEIEDGGKLLDARHALIELRKKHRINHDITTGKTIPDVKAESRNSPMKIKNPS